MNRPGAPFPEHLRHPHRRRIPVRTAAVALAATAVLASPLAWRVRRVELVGTEAVPAPVRSQLEALPGTPMLAVHPDELRLLLKRFPPVAQAAVRRDLDGTLRIRITPARPVASVRVGRGWHGVSQTGEFTGRIPEPVAPQLRGFPPDPRALRRALATAERLEAELLGPVQSVEHLIPDVFVVHAGSRGHCELRVAPEPTGAERWLAARKTGLSGFRFLDLTGDRRLVVRRGEPG